MGHHVHELCLGFRFPSLSLKPPSEGRYDYIALVPLDFRPARTPCAEIYPQALPEFCVQRAGLYEHDLDGPLAFVRGSQDVSADLANLSDREAARTV